MKRILVLALTVLSITFVSFAQSVVITPKKVTYKRPKPQMDFKKTFTVSYPRVKAATPALSKKIEQVISYQKNMNFNLKDEMSDLQWLEDAGYIVNYNKNGILDITLSMEGSAAYPSTYNKTLVVDLKSGIRVTPQAVFTNLKGLAEKGRKDQLAEITRAKEEYKKDPDAADFVNNEYFKSAKFGVKDLEEFTVSDKGVTFIYDYGFPHVALALQPEGRYFFSWKELKPYIKPDGLLGKFIR